MEITGILIGVVISAPLTGVICFLLCERRARNSVAEQSTLRQIAEAKASGAIDRIRQLEEQLRELSEARVSAEAAKAGLLSQLEAERAKIAEQQKFISASETRLREAFQSLSMESLKSGSQHFIDLATEKFKELTGRASLTLDEKKQEMAALLQPMTQTLAQYKETLGKLESSRVDAFNSITAKLAEVATTQQILGGVTTQLSSALRRTEVRGLWGEMTLRRLFEMSGLAPHVAFEEQVSVAGDDGGLLRPDVVVTLPNERQVLIDCKAVLDAFLDATQCQDEESRKDCFRRHARQVRSRVDELSKKAYWSRFGASADYIVLFLPGEAFLYSAVEHDSDLIEYALKSKVIIASPTTLLGLLKVIEFGWEKKMVEANAEQIRLLGVELYDRIVVLANHLEKLGAALGNAVKSYNATLGSIESRVFTTARKIADLGAGGDGVIECEPLQDTLRELGATWKHSPKDADSSSVPAT